MNPAEYRATWNQHVSNFGNRSLSFKDRRASVDALQKMVEDHPTLTPEQRQVYMNKIQDMHNELDHRHFLTKHLQQNFASDMQTLNDPNTSSEQRYKAWENIERGVHGYYAAHVAHGNVTPALQRVYQEYMGKIQTNKQKHAHKLFVEPQLEARFAHAEQYLTNLGHVTGHVSRLGSESKLRDDHHIDGQAMLHSLIDQMPIDQIRALLPGKKYTQEQLHDLVQKNYRTGGKDAEAFIVTNALHQFLHNHYLSNVADKIKADPSFAGKIKSLIDHATRYRVYIATRKSILGRLFPRLMSKQILSSSSSLLNLARTHLDILHGIRAEEPKPVPLPPQMQVLPRRIKPATQTVTDKGQQVTTEQTSATQPKEDRAPQQTTPEKTAQPEDTSNLYQTYRHLKITKMPDEEEIALRRKLLGTRKVTNFVEEILNSGMAGKDKRIEQLHSLITQAHNLLDTAYRSFDKHHSIKDDLIRERYKRAYITNMLGASEALKQAYQVLGKIDKSKLTENDAEMFDHLSKAFRYSYDIFKKLKDSIINTRPKGNLTTRITSETSPIGGAQSFASEFGISPHVTTISAFDKLPEEGAKEPTPSGKKDITPTASEPSAAETPEPEQEVDKAPTPQPITAAALRVPEDYLHEGALHTVTETKIREIREALKQHEGAKNHAETDRLHGLLTEIHDLFKKALVAHQAYKEAAAENPSEAENAAKQFRSLLADVAAKNEEIQNQAAKVSGGRKAPEKALKAHADEIAHLSNQMAQALSDLADPNAKPKRSFDWKKANKTFQEVTKIEKGINELRIQQSDAFNNIPDSDPDKGKLLEMYRDANHAVETALEAVKGSYAAVLHDSVGLDSSDLWNEIVPVMIRAQKLRGGVNQAIEILEGKPSKGATGKLYKAAKSHITAFGKAVDNLLRLTLSLMPSKLKEEISKKLEAVEKTKDKKKVSSNLSSEQVSTATSTQTEPEGQTTVAEQPQPAVTAEVQPAAPEEAADKASPLPSSPPPPPPEPTASTEDKSQPVTVEPTKVEPPKGKKKQPKKEPEEEAIPKELQSSPLFKLVGPAAEAARDLHDGIRQVEKHMSRLTERQQKTVEKILKSIKDSMSRIDEATSSIIEEMHTLADSQKLSDTQRNKLIKKLREALDTLDNEPEKYEQLEGEIEKADKAYSKAENLADVQSAFEMLSDLQDMLVTLHIEASKLIPQDIRAMLKPEENKEEAEVPEPEVDEEEKPKEEGEEDEEDEPDENVNADFEELKVPEYTPPPPVNFEALPPIEEHINKPFKVDADKIKAFVKESTELQSSLATSYDKMPKVDSDPIKLAKHSVGYAESAFDLINEAVEHITASQAALRNNDEQKALELIRQAMAKYRQARSKYGIAIGAAYASEHLIDKHRGRRSDAERAASISIDMAKKLSYVINKFEQMLPAEAFAPVRDKVAKKGLKGKPKKMALTYVSRPLASLTGTAPALPTVMQPMITSTAQLSGILSTILQLLAFDIARGLIPGVNLSNLAGMYGIFNATPELSPQQLAALNQLLMNAWLNTNRPEYRNALSYIDTL